MNDEVDPHQIREIAAHLRSLSNGADAAMLESLLHKHQQLVEVAEASAAVLADVLKGLPHTERYYIQQTTRQLSRIQGAMRLLK